MAKAVRNGPDGSQRLIAFGARDSDSKAQMPSAQGTESAIATPIHVATRRGDSRFR